MNDQNQNKNSGGKNAYLIILTIVTVICIIFGVFWNIGGWFGHRWGSRLFDHNWSFGYTDAGDMSHETMKVDDFDTIEVDLEIGQVKLEVGNGYGISYDFPEKYVPECKVTSGKLTAKQPRVHNVSNNANDDYELIITVPKDADLNKVKIYCALGDIVIEGVDADKFDINESLGEIRIKDAKCETLEADNSLGSINISNVEAKTLDANLSMGDLRVTSSDIEDVRCNNSMGSVEFSGDCAYLDINNNMGDVRIDTKSDWKGSLATDMGVVKVNGENMGTNCKR